MKRRILCIVLTICMAFMLMPTVVLAAEVTVTTEEELKDAVQSGGTINLGADIALAEPLIVNDPTQDNFSLTLNMNGYTLTGTIKLTACMFTLNGRLDADVEAKAYVDPSNSWPSNLYGGTYAGEVHLDTSCIHSGTFKNKVSGSGVITGGTFYEDVNCEEVTGGSFLGSCTVTGRIDGGIFYGAYSQDKVIEFYTLIYNSNDEVHAIEFRDNYHLFGGAEAPSKKGYSFQGWYEKDNNGEFRETPKEFPFRAENLPTGTVINVYAQWKDIQKPVIAGLENGKTYCDAVEFTVSDNDGIASVKANDVELTATDGKYTLSKGVGTVTVVAKDNADNEASVTVTVNNGHTPGNDDGNCETPVYCVYHPNEIAVAAKSHDFSGEWQSNRDETHTRYCTVTGCDGYETKDCTGGEATCTSKAICEYCKTEYGELDSSNHNLEKISATDATVTETGNKEYWHCKDCGKYFADENGTKEIKLEDTIISKLSPEIIEGKGQSITAGEKKELTFKSNAAFSDFIRVELDGKTLDAKNYTVKEGSTVVTLKADYVATLSAGEHTIGIVSESGTATTTFTVDTKAVVDNDTKSPQTGDNSHMALWIALLFMSGAGVIGTTVYGKKKRAK